MQRGLTMQALKHWELVWTMDPRHKRVAEYLERGYLQRGIVALPKSVTPSRIAANADLFGFELSDADMVEINAMDRDQRVGPNPDHIDF